MGDTMEFATREQFLGFLGDALPELVEKNPQIVLAALAKNGDAMRKAFLDSGFIVAAPATPDPREITRMHEEQQGQGRIIGGFGARFRRSMPSRVVDDPYAVGGRRRTYLFGEQEKLAEAWVRCLMERDLVNRQEGSEFYGKDVRQITRLMNEATRAPSTPITTETGTGGGFLVPLSVAAEIFEESNERFVLRNLVQVFTSAVPLRIPKRINQITVSRGAPASDLSEKDPASLIGALTLQPERVGALAYVDPQLALAAAVGPVRWIVGQFAEAMAKEYQRVIVAGDRTLREPIGINTLPTSGGNAFDNAQTNTFDDTSNTTRRNTIRKCYFKIKQPHRESGRFVFIGNGDMANKLASVNDLDQKPWADPTTGAPQNLMAAAGMIGGASFFGKQWVETTAIATASNQSTLLGGDMGQYAWQEAPDGLRMEQTTVGGKAFESDTIGIKVVQSYDGGPVTPVTFMQVPAIPV